MTELLREDDDYAGSVDLVKRRLATLRPKPTRAAQRTGYRPGQVLQVDWAEMPTRPRIGGRERRVYALICALPYSGASTAHFSFEMTVESFLEGHVRAFAWLGGVPRECVYDTCARRSRAARGLRMITASTALQLPAPANDSEHVLRAPQVPRCRLALSASTTAASFSAGLNCTISVPSSASGAWPGGM
jgi:hypothetical protein